MQQSGALRNAGTTGRGWAALVVTLGLYAAVAQQWTSRSLHLGRDAPGHADLGAGGLAGRWEVLVANFTMAFTRAA